ncbi:hypothetical protein PENTCL1PPCAC_18493, partial [Pristionchus entomophagus]
MEAWLSVVIIFVSLVAALVLMVILVACFQKICCKYSDEELEEMQNRPPISVITIENGCQPRRHHHLAAFAIVRHHHRR